MSSPQALVRRLARSLQLRNAPARGRRASRSSPPPSGVPTPPPRAGHSIPPSRRQRPSISTPSITTSRLHPFDPSAPPASASRRSSGAPSFATAGPRTAAAPRSRSRSTSRRRAPVRPAHQVRNPRNDHEPIPQNRSMIATQSSPPSTSIITATPRAPRPNVARAVTGAACQLRPRGQADPAICAPADRWRVGMEPLEIESPSAPPSRTRVAAAIRTRVGRRIRRDRAAGSRRIRASAGADRRLGPRGDRRRHRRGEPPALRGPGAVLRAVSRARRKYSCALWPDGSTTWRPPSRRSCPLCPARAAARRPRDARSGLRLGSLTLWLAERFPRAP